MIDTLTIIAAGLAPACDPEDPARRREIDRLEREWTESASALTAWAIACERDASPQIDHDLGYRLAFRALESEARYLAAVRRPKTPTEPTPAGMTGREYRARRAYDAARADVKTLAVLGAGLGHTITMGCGHWRPVALVPSSHPFETRLRDAAVVRLKLTADAWRSHVGFHRAARRAAAERAARAAVRPPIVTRHAAGPLLRGTHPARPQTDRRGDPGDPARGGRGVHPVHPGAGPQAGGGTADGLALPADRAALGGVHPPSAGPEARHEPRSGEPSR